MNDFPSIGVRGPQGPTGPAGATYTINAVVIGDNALSSAITIIASAPATGTLTFWGQVSGDATAATEVTMIPKLGGASLTTLNAKVTTASTNDFWSMAIAGQQAITIGDAFQLTFSLGAGTGTTDTGCILYSIQ